jgi:antitoxin component YwqK of YwqJK toxin-antitoxin module
MTLENYKNGKLEGLRSVYYPSGKIAEEISYLNNIKTVFTRVFENGIILEQSIYKNNEYNGLATFKDARQRSFKRTIFKREEMGIWQILQMES